MVGYSNFYGGADYGLESSKYNDDFLKMNYRTPVSNIGLATDARTANQLKTTAEKLNTGAMSVEVQLTMLEVAESVPNQHLDELNRLRKLAGVDFTLHGPLVEPTGVTKNGWDPTQRQQAERQMWTALERAHRLKNDGNIVVTFHSSNGLPDPETKVFNEKTQKEETKGIWVVDQRTGNFTAIPNPTENYLEGKKPDAFAEVIKTNSENWQKQLSQASFHAHTGGQALTQWAERLKSENLPDELKSLDISSLYKLSKTPEGQRFMQDLTPEAKKFADKIVNDYNYGEIYVREAYNDLKNLFNQAYDAAVRNKNTEDKNKLEEFRSKVIPKLKDFEDPKNISNMANEVLKGVNLLNTVGTPQTFTDLRTFAIDQASETFSNLAVQSYDKFKENAPIISIENPPAGSGLHRAEELKDLIKMSRDKFVEKATDKNGMAMSKGEAEKQADKLIGATWDVGHINMLRKFGYGEKKLQQQTETIGEFVKHVHLSDNFGMEHTELPMGMGNVPTKMHMDILDKYNKQLKKVVETGNWYQHFQTTPFQETIAAFGSPIYGMTASPSWDQISGRMNGAYFSGYGMNPDIHHSMYGAGFANLPVELGGQMAGRSRLSGAPME